MLYFRLSWTLFKAFFRKRIHPLEESTLSFRVLPTDLDFFMHMNNGRYPMFMDAGRLDLVIRFGVMRKILREKWIIPLGFSSLEYRQPLRLFQKFVLTSQIVWWDETWFYFKQQFRDPKRPNVVLCTGYVKTLFRGHRGILRPSAVIEMLGGTELQPPAPSEELLKFSQTSAQTTTPARSVEVQTTQWIEAREPLAIVGIGCRFPGGVRDTSTFWQLLAEGKDAISDVPSSRWNLQRYYDSNPAMPAKMNVRQCGFLQEDLTSFDARFFGISPREAASVDPQQRLLLEVAWEALENAGIPPSTLAGTKTGVFIGAFTLDNMLLQLREDNLKLVSNHTATSVSLTLLSNRLSFMFDFRGPSISIDTACSSSLVALHYACESIWRGESTSVLAGGVNAILLPEITMTMSKGYFLSPDARCKAFDSKANGYARGEGAGVVFVKPLSVALADGNPIHAVIRSTAVNQDGRTSGVTVPNVNSQIDVMRTASKKVGIEPTDIVYVEAHGTGTPVGDPIEAKAIGTVYGEGRTSQMPCAIGSVKTNIGHLEAASGIAGVIKTVLCLKEQQVPPHLHLRKINPAISLDELGLRIPLSLETLHRNGKPLLAAVNSFGYGGTNAHVILEQAPSIDSKPSSDVSKRQHLILPLSAKTPEALSQMVERHVSTLSTFKGHLADYCRSAGVNRDHHDHRLAICFENRTELVESLQKFKWGSAEDVRAHQPPERGLKKVVFVYTGMGPQWWAMGRQLMANEPVYKTAIEECDGIFSSLSGWSIAKALSEDESRSQITRTEIAQPANVVLQIALTRLWESWGVKPDAIVGHSVGEVAAAYVSGALSLENALKVSFHRSRLQQRFEGLGTMLAVGLGADEVTTLLSPYEEKISIAAINSARTVTVAGDEIHLQRLFAELQERGCFTRFLKVKVPYHSHKMDPIRSEVFEALADLKPLSPKIPLFSTVTGNRVDGAIHDAEYWWGNIRKTVLFAKAMDALLLDDCRIFVEVGAHPVLASAIRECLSHRKTIGKTIASLDMKRSDGETVSAAVADLYALGQKVDWSGYYGSGPFVPLPTYAWQKEFHWNESEASRNARVGLFSHPLLQNKINSPSPRWKTELSTSALSYLNDHKVEGTTLFPGAAYVEMALALNHSLFNRTACSIENLSIQSSVVLKPNQSTSLDIHWENSGNVFRISHLANEQTWITSARGNLLSPGKRPGKKAIHQIETKTPDGIAPSDLYGRLKEIGLHFGPAFQAVKSLRSGSHEVFARVQIPDEISCEDYFIHPVVLDASFHSLWGALSETDWDQNLLLPVSIDRIAFFEKPGRSVFVHGRVTRKTPSGVCADFSLLAEDGTVYAEINGFYCKVVPKKRETFDQRLSKCLYRNDWEKGELSLEAPKRLYFVLGKLPNIIAHESVILLPGRDLAESSTIFEKYSTDSRELCLIDSRFLDTPRFSADGRLVGRAIDIGDKFLGTLQRLGNSNTLHRYFLLTVNAHHVRPLDAPPRLEFAPLLGLARTAMSEFPKLHLSHVDLDYASLKGADLRRILDGIGNESEVAIRSGELFISRLIRETLDIPSQPETGHEPNENEAFELDLGKPGKLETLSFTSSARRPPGPDEIEIKVEAVALGFKDVMKALDRIPDRVVENTSIGHSIGMEGTGIVVAAGEKVTELKVGDRVTALAPSFFRSFLTVRAVYAARIPDGFSFEQAATLIAFMTAYHALINVAKLSSKERVLIHSASGSLGLAAIQVAKWRDAEVYVTAGTDEKRQYLRDKSVHYVGNSRNVEFADEVRALTDGKGVDVVVNFATGEVMLKSLTCLAPFGRFIEIGKGSFDGEMSMPLQAFNQNLSYVAVDLDRFLAAKEDEGRLVFQAVMERLRAGDFTPLPITVFPAHQVSDAFRTMARAEHIGKIVVSMKDPQLRVRTRKSEKHLFNPKATYLITGGLGGFGLRVARWMVAKGAHNLFLVSRRGASSPEAATFLEEMERSKVNVQARSVDVSDEAAVNRLISEIQSTMSPLKGIIHGAMVLEDKPLMQIDRSSLERVMAPKALGAWNLHCATRELSLEFMIYFSSISSLVGYGGQGNYVAANLFLDQLAEYRRNKGLPALTLNLGIIGDVGIIERSQHLTDHLRRKGITEFKASEVLKALERLFDYDKAQVGIMDIDWATWSRQAGDLAVSTRLNHLMSIHDAGNEEINDNRTKVLLAAPEKREELVGSSVLAVVAKVLRTTIDSVEVNEPLRNLGVDSIMTMEIIVALETEFGISIPPMEIVAGPSTKEIVKLVLSKLVSPCEARFSSTTNILPPIVIPTLLPEITNVEGIPA